jgi:hypothetical protein
LNNPNNSEDDWEAHNKSDMSLDNGSLHSATLEQQKLSVAPNVPELIWPICWSKNYLEQALIRVNIIDTKRKKGIRKMLHRICH